MQHQVHGNNLYSISDGQVVYKQYDADGYGYYIIIKSTNGMGFLYAHMQEASPLNVGDSVNVGDYIGHEGTSGSSTGIHLHLEMQDLTNNSWQFGADISKYLNPTEFLGIPNVQGISAIYYGTPIPPTPKTQKTRFKWVLYAKKLRQKRINL